MRRRTVLGGLAAIWGQARLGAAPTPLLASGFTTVLTDLDAPEDVASAPDGRLFLSNAKSAVAVLERDGTLRQVGAPLASTGLAVDGRGRVIVANMGLLAGTPGPLQGVDVTTGAVETLVDAIEGRTLVASNCPAVARDGTIYCSHSSWGPVQTIGRTDPSGFVYMVRPNGVASIVARGLLGPNGVALDRTERYLYVSLTATGRVRRWPRRPDGALGTPQDFGPILGTIVPGQTVAEIRALDSAARANLGYPDNIAFDVAGNLWIALPFANRLIALTPNGTRIDVAHDPAGAMLDMPTSFCWGGADLKDLYVVSRRGRKIVRARTTVAGLPRANWPAA